MHLRCSYESLLRVFEGRTIGSKIKEKEKSTTSRSKVATFIKYSVVLSELSLSPKVPALGKENHFSPGAL